MWKILLRIHLVLQNIGPHTVKYSKLRDIFYLHKYSKDTLYSALITLNIVLICFAFLIEFTAQSEDIEESSIQLEILKWVLRSLNLIFFLLGLVATWTFSYRSNASCWMMNQARNFYHNRITLEIKGTRWNSLLFELIIQNISSNIFLALVTIAFSPFICKTTPIHLIHSIIFSSQPFSLKLTTLSAVYMVTIGTFMCCRIAKLLFYICTVLYESQFMLRYAYGSHSNFQSAIHLYKQGFLFIKEYNSFGILFFPFMMTVGLCVAIVMSFVCIKFHSEFPLILTLSFGGFDVASLVVTVGLYAYTMASSEECDKFNKYWSDRCWKMKKVERKQLFGCPPIRVEIGIFFIMKRTTLLKALDQVVNATVTLLLLEN